MEYEEFFEVGDDETPEEEENIDYESQAHRARNYQLELYEHAKSNNSILVLGTGSGKTFIAILLIKHLANELRGDFPVKAKRTIMVANTVPLVRQQAKAIREHLGGFKVAQYDGSMNVDSWNEEKWLQEMRENEVLVMVSQIFLDMLNKHFISWDQVNLLIVDECHHATGNHPMREIMRHYYSLYHTLTPANTPRILGLTASVIQKKCKAHELTKLFSDLEETMGCHLITTVHHEEVLKFTTKPREIVICYDNQRFSPLSDHCKTVVSKLNSMMTEFENKEFDRKEKKLLCRVLRNIGIAIEDLGEWCGSQAIKYEIENFEEEAEEEVTDLRYLLIVIQARLEPIQKVCREAEVLYDDLEPYMSHHVAKFLELLRLTSQNCEIYALVFVKTRATAFLLTELLKKLQSRGGVYKDINARCVVGCNAGGRSSSDIARSCRSLAKQTETLNAFRAGEFNVLVCTSVLEEGVDIRKCNLVVRFDEPGNFRSFVQSKGRARAEDSMYALLVGPDSKLPGELELYRSLEKEFRHVCRNRAHPLPEEILKSFNDDLLPPYMPSGLKGPRITSASCLTVIYKYCDQLPHDRFTSLAPKIVVREVDELFVATLELPLSSPCKHTIRGKPMENREWAKKQVALEMCRLLHECGELNDSLMPLKKPKICEEMMKSIIGDDDEEDDVRGKVGSKKRRQIYKRSVCEAFSTEPKTVGACYLYRLRLDHAVRVENCEKFDGDYSLGLCTGQPIVPATFPLYNNKWGQIKVSTELVKSFSLSAADLENIKAFNKFLFGFMLDIRSEVMEQSEESEWRCLVVPLLNGAEIDGSLICSVVTSDQLKLVMPSKDARKRFVYNECAYEDAIVVPLYKSKQVYSVYRVTKETPSTKIDSKITKGLNYSEYFKGKYKLDLSEEQCMLECRHVPAELNCLAPVPEKLKKRGGEHPRLAPELCYVLPIPAHLYFQACLLPSILQRLNGLSLASDLITKIGQMNSNLQGTLYEGNRGVQTVTRVNPDCTRLLQYDWCERAIRDALQLHPSGNLCVALACKDDMRFDYFNNVVVPGHNSALAMDVPILHVLQALTPLKTMDCFNFERVEVLGDSFLKFHLGQLLFLQYPQWHEGKLTAHRSQFATKLAPRESGPAPGFSVKRTVKETLLQRGLSHERWHCYSPSDAEDSLDKSDCGCYDPWAEQSVPDKMVADSMEALLGSWMLSTGLCSTHHLLLLLGFPVHASVQGNADRGVLRLYHHYRLEQLEKDVLHYSFRNKSFLLQAVTHPTFTTNKFTDYYQRLEFLGDAVLDFLVTGHVFAAAGELSPGRITDIRCHFVRNDTLAHACVKSGMHRFLQHHCPTLHGVVNIFVDLVERESRNGVASTTESNFVPGATEAHGPSSALNMENDVQSLDQVEVPKALGDLVEAIIGAVYLDSDLSLDKCWELIQRLMPDLKNDRNFAGVGIDCVRLMHENVVIENQEKFNDGGLAEFRIKAAAKLVLQRLYGDKWATAGK
ncbi:hypothetical protein HAZT_HAZT006657 [Hyalella azteca]|uniref:Uncharacterized protein n=1 Tax=Hyalella azteca TaxID=294128 RepID=A0A6A0GT60_HYAAZ|nr:hypothetical protein HAZT_HAZT006657 [Hyalella azteca]